MNVSETLGTLGSRVVDQEVSDAKQHLAQLARPALREWSSCQLFGEGHAQGWLEVQALECLDIRHTELSIADGWGRASRH
jgi:hypothetical protein